MSPRAQLVAFVRAWLHDVHPSCSLSFSTVLIHMVFRLYAFLLMFVWELWHSDYCDPFSARVRSNSMSSVAPLHSISLSVLFLAGSSISCPHRMAEGIFQCVVTLPPPPASCRLSLERIMLPTTWYPQSSGIFIIVSFISVIRRLFNSLRDWLRAKLTSRTWWFDFGLAFS